MIGSAIKCSCNIYRVVQFCGDVKTSPIYQLSEIIRKLWQSLGHSYSAEEIGDLRARQRGCEELHMLHGTTRGCACVLIHSRGKEMAEDRIFVG